MNDKVVLSQKAQRWLAAVSAGETFTGLAFLLAPSLVFQLLFGGVLSGDDTIVVRFAGIVLTSFGITCWLGKPLIGWLIYNAAVTLYLLTIGLGGLWTGVLLWPVFVLHLILSIVFARLSIAENKD
ncbi:hypothetical protein [Synechococcus sp. RedBA-s]|uniref:hypothetical protein n=1 Tax=Synechococcus sp. RedBA-s TaxID=2823741 RepID=UPI0020CF5705|nr:hypothetical protein [Synechococcus sp. RedBA-s]MCP9800282.1 hypothetical protein [Synechococcus sp. RedBA-s]